MNKKTKPKVSVCVPVYNAEKHLKDCLDCLINQTLKDIEIICVDDGSTDKSGCILKDYSKKDGRIKVISLTKNSGTHIARKKAVNFSSGDYIMFCDADDFYDAAACEVAYKNILIKKADVLKFQSDIQQSYTLLPHNINFCIDETVKIENNIDIITAYFDANVSGYLWNKIYDGEICRKAFLKMQDIELKFVEDVYETFVILYYTSSYAQINDKLHNYNHSYGNEYKIFKQTQEGKNEMLNAYAKNIDNTVISIKNFIEDNAKDDKEKQKLMDVCRKIKILFLYIVNILSQKTK